MKLKPLDANSYLALNVLGCIILTGLVAYNPNGIGDGKGLLSYPEWAAPLVFMLVTLLFAGSKFRTPKHTLMNMGLIVLSGILLIFPLPAETAATIKWWYPLGAGLIVNMFIDLD